MKTHQLRSHFEIELMSSLQQEKYIVRQNHWGTAAKRKWREPTWKEVNERCTENNRGGPRCLF